MWGKLLHCLQSAMQGESNLLVSCTAAPSRKQADKGRDTEEDFVSHNLKL